MLQCLLFFVFDEAHFINATGSWIVGMELSKRHSLIPLIFILNCLQEPQNSNSNNNSNSNSDLTREKGH